MAAELAFDFLEVAADGLEETQQVGRREWRSAVQAGQSDHRYPRSVNADKGLALAEDAQRVGAGHRRDVVRLDVADPGERLDDPHHV